MRAFHCIYLLPLISLFGGCSKAPPVDDGFVASSIQMRINSEAEWRMGVCQNDEVIAFINDALTHELTADVAIQVALLNSPKIQAIFEELGIAHADLIEAGLLTNPFFEVEIRYPFVKNLQSNIEYYFLISLLDAVLVPLRTQLATTEFLQAKLRVTNEILSLSFDVKETYYELVSEQERLKQMQSIFQLADISGEIASRQNAIGNIGTLEYHLSQSRLMNAEITLAQSQTEIIRLNEKLHRLLGLTRDAPLILPQKLPEVTYQDFDLCALESAALENRIDLQIARNEISRLCQMLGLKDWWTYTDLRSGISGKRETDGSNLLGPIFTGNLPIFNYGQGARLRLFAQLRQAQDHLEELEIQVLSEVREAHKLLTSYSKIAQDYQNRLLPLQSEMAASSEKMYNVMGVGVHKLLENKLLEIQSNLNYTESVKKYLVTTVSLDRAMGGDL